jgi:hypothetical protein
MTSLTKITTPQQYEHQQENSIILGRLQTQLVDCGTRLEQATISEFQETNEQSSIAAKNRNSNTSTTTTTTAAICAIQKGARYHHLDEWVDYNVALGFDTIYIYDNSDEFELRQWADLKNPHRVVVRHFPGYVQQLAAYQDCQLKQQRSDEIRTRSGVSRYRHDWLAFLDVDEFIVLKQHDTIQQLVQDLVPHDKAGLALHRLSFYFDEQTQLQYEPRLPVTKRFQHRLVQVDTYVKTISKTAKIARPDVHYVNYVGKKQLAIDTGGRTVLNGYSPKRPTDVAVIHHYETKSLQEFQSKCRRGSAFRGNYYMYLDDHNNNDKNKTDDTAIFFNSTTDKLFNSTTTTTQKAMIGNQRACMPQYLIIETFRNQTIDGGGVVFDDAAWRFLAQAVPQYSRYNGI